MRTDTAEEELRGREEGRLVEYAYASLAERIKQEWKIYVVSFVFALIAGLIGQIAIPLGPGQIILFPIIYSIILGILSGPEVVKIFNRKEVKAASKIVIIAICPFIAKIGINAGASLDTVVSAGPALFSHAFGDILTIFITLPVALPLGLGREAIGAASSITARPTSPSWPTATVPIRLRIAAASPSTSSAACSARSISASWPPSSP